MIRAPLGVVLFCLGCSGALAPTDVPPAARHPQRLVLGFDEVEGLSGLTTDGDGTLWALPERDRQLVAIRDERVTRVVSFDGALGDLDAEALTWLGGARFAIGTESDDATRLTDRIFVVEVAGERANVIDELDLPYAAIGAVPDPDDGLEGLCHVDGELIAAVEHVLEADGERFAACGRVTLEGARQWRPFRVRLTTDVGKISDLACRPGVGGVEVLAIERGLHDHRWVARVIRFVVPPASDGAVLVAEEVFDLDGWTVDRPNPEGITVDGAGDIWMVVDNHYHVRTGPNELLHIPREHLPD